METIPALKTMLSQEAVKARFKEILGENAAGFVSSILSVANNNKLFQSCDPQSIMNAAIVAATLDLQINPNLGFSYIIPYGRVATFQIGYKGIINLALRTGQYQKIEVNEVHEGEIKKVNRFTGEYEFGERTSDTIVGYLAYFKLINGFEKFLYMSKEECEKHAKKYSQTYKKGTGLWATEFDQMSKKTCIKQLLSKFGILSVKMRLAQQFDTAYIKSDLSETSIDDAEFSYIDNPNSPEAKKAAMKEAIQDAQVVDESTGELFNQE